MENAYGISGSGAINNNAYSMPPPNDRGLASGANSYVSNANSLKASGQRQIGSKLRINYDRINPQKYNYSNPNDQ